MPRCKRANKTLRDHWVCARIALYFPPILPLATNQTTVIEVNKHGDS